MRTTRRGAVLIHRLTEAWVVRQLLLPLLGSRGFTTHTTFMLAERFQEKLFIFKEFSEVYD